MIDIAGFHAHLDECRQCREPPFQLCPVGAARLMDAYEGDRLTWSCVNCRRVCQGGESSCPTCFPPILSSTSKVPPPSTSERQLVQVTLDAKEFCALFGAARLGALLAMQRADSPTLLPLLQGGISILHDWGSTER